MENLKNLRVAVIATDGFEAAELFEPVKALREAGARVEILSMKEGEIQGMHHMAPAERVRVDRPLRGEMAEQYDALLLPGGALNADHLRLVPEVQSFVKSFQRAHKPMAVICHAPWVLVSAGLVKNRTLTSYYTIRDDIRNAGGQWTDQEVVRDENWVTSRQPADIPSFNREMISLFSGTRAPATAAAPGR